MPGLPSAGPQGAKVVGLHVGSGCGQIIIDEGGGELCLSRIVDEQIDIACLGGDGSDLARGGHIDLHGDDSFRVEGAQLVERISAARSCVDLCCAAIKQRLDEGSTDTTMGACHEGNGSCGTDRDHDHFLVNAPKETLIYSLVVSLAKNEGGLAVTGVFVHKL